MPHIKDAARRTCSSRFGFVSSALVASVLIASPAEAATVKVATAQISVVDGDIAGNLGRADTAVKNAAAMGAKIVVLAELVDVGFGNIVKAATGGQQLMAPIPGGPTAAALAAMAVKYKVWISGAIFEQTAGGGFDTTILIN